MSDQAEAGSVVADAQPAGAPAQPAPIAENGSAAVSDTPFSGLSEGARKWVETKGYKSQEDIVTAALSLEQRLGTSVTPPPEDASKEDLEKYYAKLPEHLRPITSPDKFEFKRPENLPADLPYDDGLANTSKTWMAEAGLSARQAQTVHDKFAGHMAEMAKANQAEVAKSVETTYDDLVKDWGTPDSEGFKKKLDLAGRAADKFGVLDELKGLGAILPDGAVTKPGLAKMLAFIGENHVAEDSIGNDSIPGQGNPFKKNADGERDLKGITALIKSDPKRAERMARAAGENPETWMPKNPL